MDSQHPDVAAQLETLAAQLNAVAQNLRSSNTSLTSNPAERMKLLKLINNFASTIKEPQDDIMETMISSAKLAATNLFLKWDVFEMIPVDGTISYSELAKNTGADVNLISRLLFASRRVPPVRNHGRLTFHSPRCMDAWRDRRLEANRD